MKQRLDQLTLQQLIELSCGDYSVLMQGDETPSPTELMGCATSIMSEYKSIAAPSHSKMDLLNGEKLSKLKMKELCARICMMLCESGHADKAREVLKLLYINEEHMKTDDAVRAQCRAILGEVEYERNRLNERQAKEAKSSTPQQIRSDWYSEIASVMGVFRMNIDPASTNAAIYANLVCQAIEHSKAMAKMPPTARMFM